MKKSTIPALFGEHTRPGKEMSKEELKTTGQPFASSGIAVDEKIEFPDTENDIVVKEQPVAVGRNAVQRLLLVDRINKDGVRKTGWVSLGILNRTDYHRNPTCDFCEQMNKLDSDWDRIIALLGKTITCKETVSKDFQKFDRATGTRLEGQYESRPTPVITYVNA